MSNIYSRLIEVCIVFLIVFTPLAYGSVAPWSIATFEITAALMALCWVLKMLSENTIEFTRTPFNLFIFLFLWLVSLQFFLPSDNSLIATVYKHSTKTEILKFISLSLIFFVTLNTIRTKQKIIKILSIIIAVGFVMSLFFLMRYFGLKAPRGIINPDHFSSYLAMITSLSLGLLFLPFFTENQELKIEHRLLLFFCIVVMSVALFFTMSRGGMISYVAALFFMMLIVLSRRSIQKKGWILSFVMLFIALSIGWLGAAPVLENIMSIKDEIASFYFAGRLPIWIGTVNIIKDFPVFGTGIGTFNSIFPKYQLAENANRHVTYAHSDILQLISETGIVGISLCFVFCLWSFFWIVKRFKNRNDPWVIGLSIGLFGSLMGIFVHSFTDFSLQIPAISILLFLILALFISVLNTNHESHIGTYNISLKGKIFAYPFVLFLMGFLIFVSVKPAIAEYYSSLALKNKENTPKAINHMQYAIHLDPLNANYYYHLGNLYTKLATKNWEDEDFVLAQLDRALSQYKKAVKLNPTNSKFHQFLAFAFSSLAEKYKPELVHRHFQTAIDLEPYNPYRRQAYASWLLDNFFEENKERAIAEYKRAIALEPELAKDVLVRYYNEPDYYEVLVEILPKTHETDYSFFKLLLQDRGLLFAISFAEKYLKTYPHNAEIHFRIADSSFYDKDYTWDFTEKHYDIVFKNNPYNSYYRMWHGIHLSYKGEYKKAIQELQVAMEMGLNSQNERKALETILDCRKKL